MKIRVLLAIVGLASAPAVAAEIEPIVPYMFMMGETERMVRDLREIRQKTGLRRFYLCGPGINGVMLAPFAADFYAKMGEGMAAVKRGLADTDIELGWWCSPSIRYVSNLPKVEDAYGNKSADNKHCPLSPEFQADWTAKIKSVVAAFRPTIVNIEDDYTLVWGRGLKGEPCYCPRHLAAFAKHYGKALTGAEIAEAFKNRTPENLAIRRVFSDITGASLVELAGKVRAAVDEVDPTIRICQCESWIIDRCGDPLERTVRAFAGKTRPAVRPYGAIYGAQTTPSDVPKALGHTLFTFERLPRDIETFYEADPYPHNRFFSSAAQMQSFMSGAMFMGSQSIQLYCLQYLDDPLEDTGYADAFNAMKPRLAVVRDFIESKKSSLAGVRIVWQPEDVSWTHARFGNELNEGAFMLAKMGLPYTTRRDAACPALLMGEVSETMTDEELRAILSGGVLLDAPAAAMLKDRGFGALLGAEVELVQGRPPVCSERILPAAGCRCTGKSVNAFYFFNAGTEGTVKQFVTLKPQAETEVWTEFSGVDGKLVSPSLTLARNASGGRVAVLATSLVGNRSSGLYNLRKQEMLHNLFNRLAPGAIPVASVDAPGIWTMAQVSEDENEMLVMVNNLSGDVRKDVTLAFGSAWQGASVARLNEKGDAVPFALAAPRQALPWEIGQMMPEFLIVKKQLNQQGK